MKLKRLLAAALAGVMAMTSSVVTSVTANAEDAVYTVYEFDDSLMGVETAIVIDGDAMAAISSAKSSVDFTLNGAMADAAQGWCNYGVQMVSSPYTGIWSIDVNTTKTITPSDAEWTAFTTDTSLKFSINNIKVTTATVAVDGGTPITVYDVTKDAVSGKAFAVGSGDSFLVPASTLTDAGVTVDNFNDCSVTMTIDSLLEGDKQISLLAGQNWDTQFYWTNEYTTGDVTISFKDADATKASAVLSDGLTLYAKSLVMTKLILTVPAVEDEPVEDEEVLETGTYSDGKWSELSAEELAAAGTLNTIATAKDEYVTTTNTLSVQYNANEQKLRIYKLYNEADLTGKSSGSIVVKKGNVGLKLTAECVYSKLADGQTAPEGCYYIAWVISGVDDPTEFSYSDITLA